jgi:hypothetical protein
MWTQVSELNGFDNNAAKVYGIKGIPFNILLDRAGKIIAKNLKSAELQEFLSKIL